MVLPRDPLPSRSDASTTRVEECLWVVETHRRHFLERRRRRLWPLPMPTGSGATAAEFANAQVLKIRACVRGSSLRRLSPSPSGEMCGPWRQLQAQLRQLASSTMDVRGRTKTDTTEDQFSLEGSDASQASSSHFRPKTTAHARFRGSSIFDLDKLDAARAPVPDHCSG
jgi:hypothetical protein